MTAKTVLQKLWNDHVIIAGDDGYDLLSIDRHFIHEVSSPQAFSALEEKRHTLYKPNLTIAVTDHVIKSDPAATQSSETQQLIDALQKNTQRHGLMHFNPTHPMRGIVHVFVPEQGLLMPGMTTVCGDSHTCTLGALGCLAWGIGTSETEQVLTTQTLWHKRPQALRIVLEGQASAFVTPKDIALYIIRTLGVNGANQFAIEYAGDFINTLPMDGRFTLCNLAVECGAKIGLIAPDNMTFSYIKARLAETGRLNFDFENAITHWKQFYSDEHVVFDREIHIDVNTIAPHVTWGTTPAQSITFDETISADQCEEDHAIQNALQYMGLKNGTALKDIKIDYVFIGSCSNGRLSDLRAAAQLIKGKKIAPWVRAIVVPGSQLVKMQAEYEGLDQDFKNAGCEWRESSCSFCVSVNGDRVPGGLRCVSTSNRNFEGRQGPNSRTHLASPLIAAASAILGFISHPDFLS